MPAKSIHNSPDFGAAACPFARRLPPPSPPKWDLLRSIVTFLQLMNSPKSDSEPQHHHFHRLATKSPPRYNRRFANAGDRLRVCFFLEEELRFSHG
jgi:hypothetical protein